MQNIYRETFEQIHASEQLRKEVANVPKQEKAAFRHHISKAGLIAAALALALAGTVLAVASPPSGVGLSRSGRRDRQLDDGIPIPGDRRPDPKSGGERYQRGRDPSLWTVSPWAAVRSGHCWT